MHKHTQKNIFKVLFFEGSIYIFFKIKFHKYKVFFFENKVI